MSETPASESEGLETLTDTEQDAEPPRQETDEEVSAGTDSIDPIDPIDPVVELTADLQRLQAEFANYRKRVERDRELVREQVIANTLIELLPVLDDIGRARTHDELEGAFKSVGESLESTVSRLGLKQFGEAGDAFDPTRHEAISHELSTDVEVATCANIFQPGYEFGGRVARAAIVSVVEPEVTPQA